MYIGISITNETAINEPLVIEYDREFDELSVKKVGGEFVGYVMRRQPRGCVPFEKICGAIEKNRITAKSAVTVGGTLVAFTDSPLLAETRYVRREIEGYGVLVPVGSL